MKGEPAFKEAGGFTYAVLPASSPQAPCVWCMGMRQGFQAMGDFRVDGDPDCTIVEIAVQDWDDDLTPWPAPGLYPGDADFKGGADAMLRRLVEAGMPAIQAAESLSPRAHAVCGYSLGGLFSLYAFLSCDTFSAVGSMSGSVWYPGWADALEAVVPATKARAAGEAGAGGAEGTQPWRPRTDLEGSFAYLSLGLQERKALPEILHSVQRNSELTASWLERQGAQVSWQLVPGNHFFQVDRRTQDGIRAVASWLCAQ